MEKCLTGVCGLDEILCGGLPKGRLYLLEGDPGAGKTTLALQFLFEGIRTGEKSFYITLSETSSELASVAQSHGWSLDKLAVFELSSLQRTVQQATDNTFFHPAEIELNRTTKILMEAIEREQPARLVFDSLSELRLLAETPLRYRRQVLDFKQFFSAKNCTVLFLDDRTGEIGDSQILSIAHGVIALEKKTPDYGITRRSLNVVKLRGARYREGHHDYIIEKGGLSVFPRLVASKHLKEFVRESVSSGIAGIDQLLGGGLDRGTATMVMGPPGTGKSTLALHYATVAAERGEHVELFLFDEIIAGVVDRARIFGMPVAKHLKTGKLCIQQVDPAEIVPGEWTQKIRDAVEKKNARMIIIDSINGYFNAMPEARFLNLQLHELLAYLNQNGIVTIIVLAQQGIIGSMDSPVDLTYLADTVVLLRFFEAAGTVRQAISVIKKRSGNHERTIREFRVDEKGVAVGKPLHEFHGVLTGIPRFVGVEGSLNPP